MTAVIYVMAIVAGMCIGELVNILIDALMRRKEDGKYLYTDFQEVDGILYMVKHYEKVTYYTCELHVYEGS